MLISRALARPGAVGVAVALGLATALAAVPANAAPANLNVFGGAAAGSAVRIGNVVESGWTAAVPLCTTSLGVTHANRVAAVNVPDIGTIGAITTAVQSRRVTGGVQSHGTSNTAATSLLGGV